MHVLLLRHLQEPKKSPHFSFYFSLRKIFLEQIMSCLRRMRAENVDGFCGFSPSPTVDAGEHEEVHVLAVDDSLVDRKVIEHLLKIISCKVTAVDSGRRALQFLGLDHEEESSVGFDGLKVDLIITDYCMPGMTGYELLKKIKGSSIFRETPVVIMSSENVLARIHRCLEEGAEDFIVKPVKLSDVRRLKSYMFSEDQGEKQDKGINKRKLQETSVDDLSSPIAPPSPSKSSDLSSTPSPPSTSLPSSPRLIVSSEAESGSMSQQVHSKQ